MWESLNYRVYYSQTLTESLKLSLSYSTTLSDLRGFVIMGLQLTATVNSLKSLLSEQHEVPIIHRSSF